MTRLVAVLIVSLLPGTPATTASCLVACSMESTAGVVGASHGHDETPGDGSAIVATDESGCDWAIGAPPYAREDRRQPDRGYGVVRAVRGALPGMTAVSVSYGPSDPRPQAHPTSPTVLRL
jgi:hypothetical protein